MKVYNNFIGIDIGKFGFVCSLYSSNETKEYANTMEGIDKFIEENGGYLADGLSILETTGGYEMALLSTLCHRGFAVHRAHTRKVKSFIRSYGNEAKTDALDAKALALYGYERHKSLKLYEAQKERMLDLYELTQRREDLKQILVAEKNRLQAPRLSRVKSSCRKLVGMLEAEIKEITEEINQLIEEDIVLKKKKEILKTVPGIGEIVSNDLLVLLPEIGEMDRRQIASLAGLAPKANDSGKYNGYRAVGYGRQGIKPKLFLSAMAARNSKTVFKEFYEQLIKRGKKKMVALTALMRKILVTANARVKAWVREQAAIQSSTMGV
jgi:transposase